MTNELQAYSDIDVHALMFRIFNIEDMFQLVDFCLTILEEVIQAFAVSDRYKFDCSPQQTVHLIGN